MAYSASVRMLPRGIRLREQVVQHLAREIIAGRLAGGDELPPEPELAREFGISKVVIRECIQELAGYGLLRVQHGKRTVILEQGEWQVLAPPVQEAYRFTGGADELTRQAYDVRQILEMNAVELACRNGDQSQLDELTALLEAMRSIVSGGRDVPEFLEKDREFHDVIARAAGNMVLRAMMRDLHSLLVLNWTNSKTAPGQLAILLKQHAAIAEALHSRDPAAARATMEAHLRWARNVETQKINHDIPR